MTFGVLICTRNSWSLALRCVAGVRRVEEGIEVVIVDDGSDESAPPEGLPADVRVLRLTQRRGFPGALNSGFSALASESVVVFDADAYPLSPFRDLLEARFGSTPDLGILGFCSFDDAGAETPSLAGPPRLMPFLLGQRAAALIDRMLPNRARVGLGLPTLAGLAIRRETFDSVGGFDEGFQFLEVDVDFCLRARNRGWRVEQDRRLRLFHVGGGTDLKPGERLACFYADRSRSLSKHGRVTLPATVRELVRARLSAESLLLALIARVQPRRREALRAAAAGRALARRALGGSYGRREGSEESDRAREPGR